MDDRRRDQLRLLGDRPVLALLRIRARAGRLGSRQGGRRRALIGLALGAWLVAVGGGQPAWADEASVEDRPVSEAYEPPFGRLERVFEERLRKKTLFPRLQDALTPQPPFLRDTELLAHVRTYYLLRDNTDSPDNEAWAAGGWLRYRSGWLADTIQIGATVYTSWPLDAPADKDGTLLLAPGQEPYTVLGEAYVALQYGDHRVTGYRQEVATRPT